MNTLITRPVLRWPGSKTRHLKTLLPLLPKPDQHVCYVEPFAGGLALLLAKPRSFVEVVNDSNRDIITLYRYAQLHLDSLIHELRFAQASRANFADFKENRGLTDLQRCARFLILNRTSFAGKGQTLGFGKTKSGGATWHRAIVERLLTTLSARLDGVTIECVDWQRCVKSYDARDTFFFFDPPYLNAPTNAYDGFTEAQMVELRDTLRKLQGRWILTVDASDFCQDLFKEWTCRLVETRNGLANNRTNSDSRMRELIITPQA